MINLDSVQAVRAFIADYRWLRNQGYGRRAAWYWAGRCLPH